MIRKTIFSLTSYLARLLPVSFKRQVYRIRPLARLIRRTLNRAVPGGLSLTVVAAGMNADEQMRLNLQTEKDYWLGTYEPDLQQAVKDYVKPGMVAYDVGANIGYISLMLAKAVGDSGSVYSFEALPANLNRLEGNITLNNRQNQVTVVAAAVSDGSRPVKFLVHASGSMGKTDGSAGRDSEVYQEQIEVTGVSLDDFVYKTGNPVPDIVKMDIEGGEVLAVMGMQRLLRENNLTLFIELHGTEAARVVGQALLSAGYKLYLMQPGYPQVPLEKLDWKSYVIGIKE